MMREKGARKLVSPERWLKRYPRNPGYKTGWRVFERWLGSRGISWSGFLEHEPIEIRDIIDEYLQERSEVSTTKSLKTYNALVRSFLTANDIIVPRTQITIRGNRLMTISRLTPDMLREIIYSSSNLRNRSFLIFKFQSLQDNERMVWISRNAWPQIKPQLDEGGYRDKNGKLWNDVIKIDLACGRKLNLEKPYFTFIGKDAIDALRKYISVEKPPEDAIWPAFNSSNTVVATYLRHLRKLGLIPRTPKVSHDKGVRYGINLHEFRDVAKSLWHESGADLLVCDFCMGHIVDAMGYDKIYTLSPDYAVKEYKKAEPSLNIMSGKRMTPSDESVLEQRLADLKERNEAQGDRMEKLEEELSRLLELMKRQKDEG